MWQYFMITTITIILCFKESKELEAYDKRKPNIVIIMIDDMGFNDVSFRGSNEILTPNIDALAYNGVILNNLYTPNLCTPSRAALLTGKYPINTGMQHYVLTNDAPWSLPLQETTMAKIFQQNGYYTSLIGKWHLGMSRKAYTPTMRGFDYHYGYLGSHIDYYQHNLKHQHGNLTFVGHDFRLNLKSLHEVQGTYVTDLLTKESVDLIKRHNYNEQPLFILLSHLAVHAANDEEPLQAPQEYIDRFSYINDTARRIYAGMLTKVDDSVSEIIKALSERQVLNNTIILFLSDNGGATIGQHNNTASNYPLRGKKGTPWEGGVRSSAAIWSTQLEKLGTIWKQTIYIADFLPTLAAAIGIYLDENANHLDGLNLWSALRYGYERVEREILHNIDNIDNYVAYAKGKWKFINATNLRTSDSEWLGQPEYTDPRSINYEDVIRNTTVWRELQKFHSRSPSGRIVHRNITDLRRQAQVKCLYGMADIPRNIDKCKVQNQTICLFDLDNDPCEQENLWVQQKSSSVVLQMLERIEYFRLNAHPINNKPNDIRSNPANFQNEWIWWEDILDGNSAVPLPLQFENLTHLLLLLLSALLLLL